MVWSHRLVDLLLTRSHLAVSPATMAIELTSGRPAEAVLS
jgi:hypothetical protein